MLADLPNRADREPVLRTGMGGDDTTAIDAAVEEAVVARFDASGDDFTLVSEELGIREGGDTWVVLDPIDGSINAKRGLRGRRRGRNDGRRRLRLRLRLRQR